MHRWDLIHWIILKMIQMKAIKDDIGFVRVIDFLDVACDLSSCMNCKGVFVSEDVFDKDLVRQSNMLLQYRLNVLTKLGETITTGNYEMATLRVFHRIFSETDYSDVCKTFLFDVLVKRCADTVRKTKLIFATDDDNDGGGQRLYIGLGENTFGTRGDAASAAFSIVSDEIVYSELVKISDFYTWKRLPTKRLKRKLR